MIKKIREAILHQQFHPGILGLFVNPFYFARKGLHQHIVALIPHLSGKILDIGCGSKPYQRYCSTTKYIGLEIFRENKNADIYYDGEFFPLKDEGFDSVIINQVLEHVFKPDKFLSEINRILKVDGLLLISVPFVWDEHEQPFDYSRYSSFGLRYLLENHGFIIIQYRKSMNDVRIIFQLINAYLYKILWSCNRNINLVVTIIFISPFNILGELLARVLPHNDDLYLDNIVLAKKTKRA